MKLSTIRLPNFSTPESYEDIDDAEEQVSDRDENQAGKVREVKTVVDPSIVGHPHPGLVIQDLRPALRREVESDRPIRRVLTRSSSCQWMGPTCRGESCDPIQRAVARRPSGQALPSRKDSSVTSSDHGRSDGGTSRVVVERRTSSQSLAKTYAPSESLSTSSSHRRPYASTKLRQPPSRSLSSKTLSRAPSDLSAIPSAASTLQSVESSVEEPSDHVSGLEIRSSHLRARSSRRRRNAPRRHPARDEGICHGRRPRQALSSSSLDAYAVNTTEPLCLPARPRLAGGSTPTFNTPRRLYACPPPTPSNTDSTTCGITSTEGASWSRGSLGTENCSLMQSSFYQINVGLDGLEPSLLGTTSLHTAKPVHGLMPRPE